MLDEWTTEELDDLGWKAVRMIYTIERHHPDTELSVVTRLVGLFLADVLEEAYRERGFRA